MKGVTLSILDYSYLVHPEGSMVDSLADLLSLCTPVGLIVVSHRGVKEVVKPKLNPFLDDGMRSLFVSRLDTLSAYEQFKVNPIQRRRWYRVPVRSRAFTRRPVDAGHFRASRQPRVVELERWEPARKVRSCVA